MQENDKQHAHRLYLQMKDDIRDNKLPVGEPLKQVELSNKYNVSRIPIRDVLGKLKNEGWLADYGKRGVMVAPLNAPEAEDLYMMRMYLEPLLLGHAIPKLTNMQIGEAIDILECVNNAKAPTIQQLGDWNWQFHACLYNAANRPTLFKAVENLHTQCGRYIGFHSLELNYLDTSQKEHYQIVEAVKAKQTNRAKQILKAHISEAGEILVSHLLRSLHF